MISKKQKLIINRRKKKKFYPVDPNPFFPLSVRSSCSNSLTQTLLVGTIFSTINCAILSPLEKITFSLEKLNKITQTKIIINYIILSPR